MHRILTPACFQGVVFTRPKAYGWAEIKEILAHARQSASLCAFVDELPGGITIAGFNRDPMHMDAAHKLAILAGGWKKTAAFYLKGLETNIRELSWFKCYVQSRHAGNQHEYCHTLGVICGSRSEPLIERSYGAIHRELFAEIEFAENNGGKWRPRNLKYCMIPCHRMYGDSFFYGDTNVDALADRCQAWAAREGVSTCPNFDMGLFRVIDDELIRQFLISRKDDNSAC